MIELLDYVLDYEDNIWIVSSIQGNLPYGYIVYRVDDSGNRYNSITHKNYVKCVDNGFLLIPPYKKIFKPREFYTKNKCNLKGVWKKFVSSLNNIGISDDNIGIFGSYLVGFNIIKDVDFVIYGVDNLYLYYKNNEYIKKHIGSTYISKEHIKYQYEKHKGSFSNKCDLYKIISRNWSGVQIKKGVLSTPRFIDLNFMEIPVDNNVREVIKCRVLNGLESAMLPRRAKVLFEDEEYTLLTNLWKYQSFLQDGDVIECLASVDRKEKLIILYDKNCYVKFLN